LTSIQLIQTNYSDLIGITADIIVILDPILYIGRLYMIWLLFAPLSLGLKICPRYYACEIPATRAYEAY